MPYCKWCGMYISEMVAGESYEHTCKTNTLCVSCDNKYQRYLDNHKPDPLYPDKSKQEKKDPQ